MRTTEEFTIDGTTLTLSNLEKILYPAVGFAKGHVIDYYTRISPCMLPHLKNRAVTFKRYPNGVDKPFFYEKNCPAHRPEWVKTAQVWSKHNDRNMDYCVLNDRQSLVWAANLAALELHASLALANNLDCPTALVFDLDPGEGCNAIDCCEIALWLNAALTTQHLQSFPKTSGSKGLQVYVPLNTSITFEKTKAHALALALQMERDHPERVVHNMRKELRRGKIFIDWSQNDAHKTTVAVYSLRAQPRPFVSTPLPWSEVKRALKSKRLTSLEFDADTVLKRVDEHGDLFAPVATLKQRLK